MNTNGVIILFVFFVFLVCLVSVMHLKDMRTIQVNFDGSGSWRSDLAAYRLHYELLAFEKDYERQ